MAKRARQPKPIEVGQTWRQKTTGWTYTVTRVPGDGGLTAVVAAVCGPYQAALSEADFREQFEKA